MWCHRLPGVFGIARFNALKDLKHLDLPILARSAAIASSSPIGVTNIPAWTKGLVPALITAVAGLPSGFPSASYRGWNPYPAFALNTPWEFGSCTVPVAVSYTHLRAHETRHDLVCR